MEQSHNISSCLYLYFILLVCLNEAQKIVITGITETKMDGELKIMAQVIYNFSKKKKALLSVDTGLFTSTFNCTDIEDIIEKFPITTNVTINKEKM